MVKKDLTNDLVYEIRKIRRDDGNMLLGANRFIKVVQAKIPNVTNAQIRTFLSQESMQKPKIANLTRTVSNRKDNQQEYITSITSSTLTDKSKKQYSEQFGRLYTELGNDVFNIQKLEEYICKKYTSGNTRVGYINVVRFVAKEKKMEQLGNLTNLYEKYVEKRNDERASGVKTAKEEANWINFPDLIRLKDAIRNIDPMYHFVLSFFTDIPPMRSDVCTVKYKNYDENSDNYYKDGHLYFNTRIKMNRGRKDEFDISFMKVLIDDYVKTHNSDYLIGKEFDSKKFSQYLIKRSHAHFNKAIGIHLLRHIYLSHFYNDTLKDVDFQQIQAMLRIVNHTIATSLGYRRN